MYGVSGHKSAKEKNNAGKKLREQGSCKVITGVRKYLEEGHFGRGTTQCKGPE